MSLKQFAETLPDYAKDIRLSLGSILSDQLMGEVGSGVVEPGPRQQVVGRNRGEVDVRRLGGRGCRVASNAVRQRGVRPPARGPVLRRLCAGDGDSVDAHRPII